MGNRLKLIAGVLVATVMAVTVSSATGGGGAGNEPRTVVPASAWAPLPTALAPTGRAAVVDNERLWLSGPDGALASVAAAAPGGYLQDPAWRPDGTGVAYARFTPRAPAAPQPSVSGTRFDADIWEIARDGTTRLLAEHDAPGVQLSKPAWSSDGTSIVYVRSEFVQLGGVKSLARRIERRVIATGERVTLVDDGDWPALSANDQLLAFVRMGETGPAELWVRDLTGGEERKLTRGQYATVTSPRFSPSGQDIAFGGALYVPKRGVADAAPLVASLGDWLVPTAEAHELLDRVWMMNADGSRLRQVSQLALDGITVRWASDPYHVLIWDEDGLYSVNVVSREHALMLRPGSYRGFDWLPRQG